LKNADEESELCCGWAHIPFLDSSSRLALVNKSYDVVLNGGSVYDKNITLDPNLASINLKKKTLFFQLKIYKPYI
jgi:hypothetical protein